MDMSDELNKPVGSNEQLHMQAASWIAQLDSGRLSRADRLALAEWMARSPQHAAELKRLASLWGQLDTLIDAYSIDTRHAKKNRFRGLFSTWFQLSPLKASAYSFASVIVLAFLLVGTFFILPLKNNPSSQVMVYQTNIGERRDVELADGSVASLNTNSIIEVTYSAINRKITLRQGEVLFQVAEDAKRPFQVIAGESIVEAVGTAFLMRLYDDEFDVTVTEGVVQLKAVSNSTPDSDDSNTTTPVVKAVLSAGQATTVGIYDTPISNVNVVDSVFIEKRTAWRDGLLIFDADPLEQIVNEVARYRSETIVISDYELGALEMSGVFKTGDLETLLATLETSLDLDVVHARDDLIYLNKK